VWTAGITYDGRELEVALGTDAEPSVGDLAVALEGERTALWFDGRCVDPEAPVRGTLWNGTAVSSRGPRDAGRAAAHLTLVAGPGTGSVFPLSEGTHLLGRAPSADVRLRCPTVSRRHATVEVVPGGQVLVADLGSRNGTRLDGRWIVPGDERVEGSELRVGATFGVVERDRSQRRQPRGRGPTAPLARTPRPADPPGPAPVAAPDQVRESFDAPPLSWAAVLAPLAVSGVLAWWFGPVAALFGLIGPVLVVGQWFEGRRRARRSRRAERRQRAAQAAARATAVEGAARDERARRWAASSHVGESVHRAATGRLWEHRPEGDGLRATVGVGTPIWVPPGTEETVALTDCPIEVPLRHGGAAGIVGPSARAVAGSLVIQLATRHGPADLRIVVVVDPGRRPAWAWLAWLPHSSTPLGELPSDPFPGTTVVLLEGDVGAAAWLPSWLGQERTTAVVVAGRTDQVPGPCRVVVETSARTLTVADLETPTSIADVLPSMPSTAVIERAARSLARWSDPEGGRTELPRSVRLLELLDPAALGRQWATAGPQELRTVIGVGPGGPEHVDLVAHGPHALIAGTTGSGKSEALRCLVAGLAVGNPPDRCSFVLVDYKGGTAFDRCADLPHVVGVVTDLDEGLAVRTLTGLRAELRRREAALRRSGADDLVAHDQRAAAPLGRLVIVLDEFAALATELPDFLDGLIDLARRGRGLGLHLVLATQRPAGVVSDPIRANTNLRIALRTVDVTDGTDVVGSPAPALVPPDLPGRAHLRAGPEPARPVQLASVSSAPGADGALEVRDRPDPFEAVPPRPAAGPTDLDRLVEAACAAWGDRSRPRRPWADPLPAELPLHAVAAGSDEVLTLGLADEPDRQRRVPWGWNPAAGNLVVLGAAGSGRTSALVTIAVAASRAGPVHLYGLSRAPGLEVLARLPSVGAVVDLADLDRRERLLAVLRREPSSHRVLLLVDGFPRPAAHDLDGLRFVDRLATLVADGAGAGLATAVAADRPGSIPSVVWGTTAERLLLRLADPLDYGVVGLRPPSHADPPPGRGVAGDGRTVQLCHPSTRDLDDLAEAGGARAPSVGALPHEVGASTLPGPATDADSVTVPIGLSGDTLEAASLRLGPGDHALIAGPAGSGRTTALTTIAAALSRRGGLEVVAVEAMDDLERAVTRPGRRIVLVDDAERLDGAHLVGLVERSPSGVHVVAAGRGSRLRTAYGHWTVAVRRSRIGLALRPDVELDGDLWSVNLPRSPRDLPPGRGYLVHEGHVELVQVAR